MDLLIRRPDVLRGSPRIQLEPRAWGAPRRIVVLAPADAATYRGLVRAVTPAIERGLDGRVVATRAEGAGIEDWRAARRRWHAALRSPGLAAPVRLHLDVADCYGSIRPTVVTAALRTLGAEPPSPLVRLREELADAGVRGLPVGPEPSAILANAVLSRVDRAVVVTGATHARWVDDLAIGATSFRHATRVVDAVRRELDGVGLRLQDAKTRIGGPEAAPAAPASCALRRMR